MSSVVYCSVIRRGYMEPALCQYGLFSLSCCSHGVVNVSDIDFDSNVCLPWKLSEQDDLNPLPGLAKHHLCLLRALGMSIAGGLLATVALEFSSMARSSEGVQGESVRTCMCVAVLLVSGEAGCIPVLCSWYTFMSIAPQHFFMQFVSYLVLSICLHICHVNFGYMSVMPTLILSARFERCCRCFYIV